MPFPSTNIPKIHGERKFKVFISCNYLNKCYNLKGKY